MVSTESIKKLGDAFSQFLANQGIAISSFGADPGEDFPSFSWRYENYEALSRSIDWKAANNVVKPMLVENNIPLELFVEQLNTATHSQSFNPKVVLENGVLRFRGGFYAMDFCEAIARIAGVP